MTIGENIKRLRIQKGLTQAELGHYTGISEALIEQYELNSLKPESKHLEIIAHVLGVSIQVFQNADFDNITAMHRIFQIFRQFDGYFDSYGNLKFKKLFFSEWRNQWEVYQEELKQAQENKNKQDRAFAIEDAEDKFNYWMDIYPKSNSFNINFDEAWNNYRKTKNDKRNDT